MEELTIEMLQEIDGGAWTLKDYNKATSISTYSGAVSGAIAGSGVGAAAGRYVAGAVGNLLD
ncbi:Blp family class II bacteriocin [Clostridium sp. ZBS13]|uniref:Blp family class II bacteriocin n=1 Tax=Clostridium sp. ZBS13 TaxID=2949971 RepID=UPI002079D7AC|nr:Blp family class II bacteriocin [Clostridium sp. ZBS13]